jgi:hypothetical protein
MTEIPKQIDREVRREIAALTRPWRIIKKRDHYFLQIEDGPLLCVANNSSKRNDWQINKNIENIRKSDGEQAR